MGWGVQDLGPGLGEEGHEGHVHVDHNKKIKSF